MNADYIPFGLWWPTPLRERIDRWATSGKATCIPLLPEDYVKLSDDKRVTTEAKYNLPVTILGGQTALDEYLKKDDEDKEES